MGQAVGVAGFAEHLVDIVESGIERWRSGPGDRRAYHTGARPMATAPWQSRAPRWTGGGQRPHAAGNTGSGGMKIGIIGSGRIGGVVGRLWAQAGHEVTFASRHPEKLAPLLNGLGTQARIAAPDEAAGFGEVVLVSIPYHALEDLGRDLGGVLAGKVVLETGNPYPERDGAMAEVVRADPLGTGGHSPRALPGTRLVRAFNSVWDQTLVREAHRPDPKVGIPLAADDADALTVASGLVRDAGFEAVVVGPLARAKAFDVGAPVYNTGMSAPDLRAALTALFGALPAA
jgi:8-hydroxy-5-deazaflavin:NADPH oxidoreductase